jgi:transposase
MPSSGACSTETSTTSSRSASTSWKKGHKYLTLVYQLDAGCRRLLWIGRDRTAKTFGEFFDFLGPERSAKLEFVVSDMWKPFLSASRALASAKTAITSEAAVMTNWFSRGTPCTLPPSPTTV